MITPYLHWPVKMQNMTSHWSLLYAWYINGSIVIDSRVYYHTLHNKGCLASGWHLCTSRCYHDWWHDQSHKNSGVGVRNIYSIPHEICKPSCCALFRCAPQSSEWCHKRVNVSQITCNYTVFSTAWDTHKERPNLRSPMDSAYKWPIIRESIPCHGIIMSLWRHQMETLSRYWPFVRGIHRSPVNSTHKGQWRGSLMFSLIYVWINSWANNREAGDLRRYRAHCDVTVM